MRYIFFLITTILFVSCVTYEPYLYKSYKLNDTISVPVGSPMFTYSKGTKVVGIDPGVVSGVGEELIYAGIVGKFLKLFYREYSENTTGSYARPSYFLELQYDISQDTLIVFREYLIDILNANQRGITYIIRKEPNNSNRTNRTATTTKIENKIYEYSTIKLFHSVKETPCTIMSQDSNSVLIDYGGLRGSVRYPKNEIDYICLPDGAVIRFPQ
jgi:hypothetical protein